MTLNTALASEIQKLAPTAKLEFFECDLTAIGDSVYHFHFGTNELTQPVVWQGITYTPWAGTSTGFDYSTNGQLPRPKLTLANVVGSITALLLATQDMTGGKITRRQTMAKFLDAVNFAAGNPTADPDAHFPDQVWFVDRKAGEDRNAVELELTAAFDVTGVRLPRRQIIQNICPWRYRGAECGYTGTNYFKADDTAVGSSALDVCGKRLSSCKLRFGENAELPYGGFPGAGKVS